MAMMSGVARATYDDVNLILRLYEMRREDRLREARKWFTGSFKVKNYDEFMALCPPNPNGAMNVGRRISSQYSICRYDSLNSDWSTTPAWTIPKAAARAMIPGHPSPKRRASSRINKAAEPYNGLKMSRLPTSATGSPVLSS